MRRGMGMGMGMRWPARLACLTAQWRKKGGRKKEGESKTFRRACQLGQDLDLDLDRTGRRNFYLRVPY